MTETVRENQAAEPGKILIVDDNEELLGAISRLLELQGYSTLTAMSGEKALEVARLEKPDLILLDWILPGVDGIEVCRKLKSDETTRGMMILLVTGQGSVDNRIEGLDAGADDFILHVAARDTDDLRAFVVENLNADADVAGTQTSLIFEHLRGASPL